MSPLIDRFGRPVDYLRISVTQRCDHHCFFCHHEGESGPGGEMTPEQIERIVRIGNRHGIRKVKLTGGEALLRDDIVDIVERLAPLTDDLSLTTNGSRLGRLARELADAGLNRINVSLHSLRPDVHRKITGVDDLELIKYGIRAAIDAGMYPVKVNMTVLKGFNEDEIEDMIQYAGEIGAILQLIELQPMPCDGMAMESLRVKLDAIERDLQTRSIRAMRRSLHGRRQYEIPIEGGSVLIEVVRPHHNSTFCARCTRLRVTSDGKFKPCLLRDDNLVDIHDALEDSTSDEILERALKLAVSLRSPYWRGGRTDD
ncbi:MAG: GTP 3',8-cyclase MoaA [Candidatus Thorarchaeota archaeon]